MTADPGLQFVDSNVLVYAYDRSAGAKHLRARTLLETLWESGQGCVSVQTLQEFYVSITQKVARPLSPAVAAEIIADFEYWTVHAPQVSDVVAAIELQQRQRLSFWDALILHSAVQLGCTQVWSEDFQAGRDYNGVRVVNPFV